MNNTSDKKKYLNLVIGVVVMLFLGLIYAWSIFKAPFSKAFPVWTPQNLSLTFTISMIFFCIGGFTSGKLLAKIGNKKVLAIAAVLLFVGFFAVSRLNVDNPDTSLTMLYIFYGLFCGGGVGMGYNAILGTVTKWFPGRTGFASGVLLMGFGFGGMILGSIVNVLISSIGLFASFIVLAVISAVVVLLGVLLIAPPAAPLAPQPTAANQPTAAQKDYTTTEMMRQPAFWLFFIWSIIVSSAGLLVINSAATIAVAFGAPAVLGLIVSVFNGLGRVTVGTLMDKIGRSKSMYIDAAFLLLAGLFMLAGALLSNVVAIFVGLLFVGLSYGGSPSLSSAVIHKFFGAKNYPVNFSVNNFLLIFAAILGPMLSTELQQRSNGAYNSTFVMIICLAVIAFVLNFILKKLAKNLE